MNPIDKIVNGIESFFSFIGFLFCISVFVGFLIVFPGFLVWLGFEGEIPTEFLYSVYLLFWLIPAGLAHSPFSEWLEKRRYNLKFFMLWRNLNSHRQQTGKFLGFLITAAVEVLIGFIMYGIFKFIQVM